ncbi:glutathione S-transferase N-terminal domain-containing protein [Halomonas sp. Bachu 37]|uniref:glutathione S-transferase N-terminal domain-containing protein n=1 Tax=Halomonas kashgarensis TaxID=3084920 RepID=UPI00321718F1
MKLCLNATSPYARVVRIVASEKNLTDSVSLHWCDPWVDDPALLAVNPLGRVPALVTDDGVTLTEALLIAQYLDSQGPAPSLIPKDRQAEVLALAGLGQGLMEAAFNSVIARKHQGQEADDSLLGQRRQAAIRRTLEALETQQREQQEQSALTLGDIVVAVALDYLAFRLPELAWQQQHPSLAQWHQGLINRESFQATTFS